MLTKQQMLSALDGLIIEAERLYDVFSQDLQMWSPDFVVWLKASESTVEAIFGSQSDCLATFKGIYFQPPPYTSVANELERRKAALTWFDSGLRYAHDVLIGYRYSVDRLASDSEVPCTRFVFISHGGPTMTHVDLTCDFLTALGISPVVVSKLPNLNLSVNEKVRSYMAICSGAIALATSDDEVTAKETRTRPNVENEIGMLQMSSNIDSRIIYLKEASVTFASNYAEKVWIPFTKERIQDAFVAIAKELRAFGFVG